MAYSQEIDGYINSISGFLISEMGDCESSDVALCLYSRYGVTWQEDRMWQRIVQNQMDLLLPEEQHNESLVAFLADEERVLTFLMDLWGKYSCATPGDPKKMPLYPITPISWSWRNRKITDYSKSPAYHANE